MATSYFHGTSSSSATDDGLHAQTQCLINPIYLPYNHNNMLLLNLPTFHHAPPLQPPRLHYNLWGPATDDQPTTQQGLSLTLSSEQAAYKPFSGELDVATGTSNSRMSVVLGSRYLKSTQELLDEVVNVGKGIYKDNKKMIANTESTSGDAGDNSVAQLTTAQRQDLLIKKSKLLTMLDEVEQRYRQYDHEMQIVISSFEQAAGFGAAKSYTALGLKTISKQFRCLKDAIYAQIKATSKSLGEEDCLGVKVEGSRRLRYVDHHLRQQRALQQLGMIQPNAWRPQRGLPERAVSILRAWLFEHFLHPYPKDSDKTMLVKQTGLSRSQVSNWFINARVRLWKPMVEEMYLEEIKEQEKANGSSDNTRSKELISNKDLQGSSTANTVTPAESGEIKFEQHMKDLQSSKQESFNNRTASPTTEISTNSTVLQSHSTGFQLVGSSSEIMHNNSPTSIGTSSNTRFGNIEMQNHGAGGFGSLFSMEEIGINRFSITHEQLASRFGGNSNNGVSLTLGLHHNENLPNISATHHQHGLFLSNNIHLEMGLEIGSTKNGNEFCAVNTVAPSSHNQGTGYESIDIQNRKRFAAQLLPDFVA